MHSSFPQLSPDDPFRTCPQSGSRPRSREVKVLHSYIGIEEFGPIRTQKVEDPVRGTVQRHSADQEGEEDHVGEESCKVRNFSARFRL